MHTEIVRNITFSAAGDLVDPPASGRFAKKMLNAAFRAWLTRYAGVDTAGEEYRGLMKRLSHVRGRSNFSREELNEQ